MKNSLAPGLPPDYYRTVPAADSVDRKTPMKLTPDFLRTVQPDPSRRLELRDDDEPGLVLRVTPNGSRSWSVRYVAPGGEHRRQPLGRYPEVTLARARLLARKTKGQVAEKIDVVGEDQKAKASADRQKLDRLDTLAENYFADSARGTHKPRARAKAPRSIKEERNYWERDIKPALGARPVPSISRKEIIAFVDGMTRRSPSAGRHCHTLLRQLMSYAVMKEIIAANPALNVATVQPKPRTRFLTDAELGTLWPALVSRSGTRLSPEMSLLLRMLIVTPLRVSEVAGMRWSEIDRTRKLWIVPAERMKGKRIHAMPLNVLAMSILDEADETDRRQHLCIRLVQNRPSDGCR